MDDASTQQQAQAAQAAKAANKPSFVSNKKLIYAAVAAIIIIVAAALALAGPRSSGGSQLPQFDNQQVQQQVLAQLAIPDNISSAVRAGFASNFPTKISNASQLKLNGKPEVLYIGAEYCPYCAVERWALVIALMRFGSFTGLEYMTSSATDSYANTPTFTFANATYTSPYISFVSRELTDNKINSSTGQYTPLQHLNSSEQALFAKYDPSGSIPFIDYANESMQIGSNYNDPTILAGMNWSTMAGMLHNPSSGPAQALVGSANLVTAQICLIDNNTPASVCGQGYITTIESQLG
jgi:thiol-disulfide isomerase/thioredoxin